MPRTRPVEDIEAETVGRNAETAGHEPERPEPPSPQPPGTEASDDVGDPEPHKTCSDGTNTRAAGLKK